MKNNLIISFENGVTVSIEDEDVDVDARMTPDKTAISVSQLVGLTKLFNNICKTSKYNESNISDLENDLNFKLGPKSKELLLNVGSLKIGDFEIKNSSGIVDLTNEWKSTVAKDDEKDRFIVIEADGPDYTLIDDQDMIFVYDGKEKKTESYDEDVITHIAKHFMSKIVGDEYDY